MKIRYLMLTLVVLISLLLFVGCMESGDSSDQDPLSGGTNSNVDENGMVLIEGGTFNMGTDSDNRLTREMSSHSVTIAYNYKIFEREVTVAEYKKCVASGICLPVEHNVNCSSGDSISDFNTFGTYVQNQDQHPVNYISWNDANLYVKWLNSSDVTGDDYRLCSSAEWEYAARAGTSGDYYAGSFTGMEEYAWIPDKDTGVFHEVKDTKKPNEWGHYNMFSNVNEYVQDTLHDNYNGAPTDGSAWETGTDTRRLVRGSQARSTSKYYVRSTYSWYREPDACGYSSGIRYCQDVVDLPPKVSNITPVDNATGIEITTPIVITFNEAIDTATATVDDVVSGSADNCTGSIQLKKSGEDNCVLMAGAADVSSDDTVFTLTPAESLDYDTTYVITLNTDIADSAGLSLAADVTSDFSTKPVLLTSPSDESSAPVDTNIVITFAEAVDPLTITTNKTGDTSADACTGSIQLQKSGATTCITMSGNPDATGDNTIFTLTPAAALDYDATYDILITTAVNSEAGNALLTETLKSSFVTALPDIVKGVGLVEIPSGSFIMGVDSTSDDPSADTDEMPSRTVNISSFYMHQHETTAGEYNTCVDAGACTFTSTSNSKRTFGVAGRENNPINYVYWNDANVYVTWLNTYAEKTDYTFRLCSEAEWEYVAQGNSTEGTIFGCGDNTGACLDDYEWWAGNVLENLAQTVEGKLANHYGIYDIIGNVREWVQDEYFDAYDRTGDHIPAAPTDGSAWEDTSADTNTRVVRGGHYYTSSSYDEADNLDGARLTARFGKSSSSSRSSSRGFRVCADAK